jgi:hypothetical protein
MTCACIKIKIKSVQWEEAQVLGRVELWVSRIRGQRSCDSQQVVRVCAAHLLQRGKDLILPAVAHWQRFSTFASRLHKAEGEVTILSCISLHLASGDIHMHENL